MTQRNLYVLVGIPCSGKSTWAANQEWISDCAYISTDVHVEAYAKQMGKTYTEVFAQYMSTAVNLMTNEVIAAHKNNKDIVWDQTSTTIASRRKKLVMLPEYAAIAIVFTQPGTDELMKRLASRPGKTIPLNIVTNMIDGFELPTEDEGFTEIWYV
jgi:predicted kinase